MKIEYKLSDSDTGRKIRDILLENYPLNNRGVKWLRFNSGIWIDDAKRKISDLVPANSHVLTVQMPDAAKAEEQNPSRPLLPLEVLYEDDCLLAVWKPENVPVHPSKNEIPQSDGSEISLTESVKAYLHTSTVYPVGRLDKEVAGVMLFGKNHLLASMLEEQKKRQKLIKMYEALCHGKWDKTEGTIDVPIGDTDTFNRYEVNEQGKPAISHYRVLRNEFPYSLVQVQIETGRTHQIRLHMNHMGHPIAGDQYYGIPDGFAHCQLYASRLELEHPITKEWIMLENEISFSQNCPL